jgi:hypothetical protein
VSEATRGDQPTTVAALLERIDRAWGSLVEEVDLSSEDRFRHAGEDGWTVKDHLAHVTAWERAVLALLERRPRYEALGVSEATWEAGGIDAVNAALHALHRDLQPAEVVGDLLATHTQLREVVAGLTDEDLMRPYADFQPDDPRGIREPVIEWIAGDTYEHFEEHLEIIRGIAGRPAGA